MRPLALDANQPADRFYAGGRQIAAFRGRSPAVGNVPEDWVASVTTLFGEQELGLSRLPDGRLLRDAIEETPEAWLGAARVAAFGPDPALLVKLLDAGQRLPVHAHPDVAFAREYLGLGHGKTEAWVFLEAATVHLAFTRDVGEDELHRWVANQDVSAMLGAMHTLDMERGDAVLVPAGIPHAIGEGAFLVELQEPTDLSILMEWEGFDIDGHTAGHLGLGFRTALAAVDRHGWSDQEVVELRSARASDSGELLPQAGAFFRAERVRGSANWTAGYSVVIGVSGNGRIVDAAGEAVTLAAGQTVVVPHGAGNCRLEADDGFEVLRCRPPAPPSAPH